MTRSFESRFASCISAAFINCGSLQIQRVSLSHFGYFNILLSFSTMQMLSIWYGTTLAFDYLVWKCVNLLSVLCTCNKTVVNINCNHLNLKIIIIELRSLAVIVVFNGISSMHLIKYHFYCQNEWKATCSLKSDQFGFSMLFIEMRFSWVCWKKKKTPPFFFAVKMKYGPKSKMFIVLKLIICWCKVVAVIEHVMCLARV